jgi:hypothetical protein
MPYSMSLLVSYRLGAHKAKNVFTGAFTNRSRVNTFFRFFVLNLQRGICKNRL